MINELVRRAQAGDSQAFAALFTQYYHLAIRVAQQILRTNEAAEDAVQDSMLKVYRALPRFKEGNFRSWLLRIVTNTCYDHLRRAKRQRVVSLDNIMADGATVGSNEQGRPANSYIELFTANDKDLVLAIISDETYSSIIESIETLPSWHRNVVLLIDVHGLDYEEAAEQLGVPLGTVKSRLSRARAALRARLKGNQTVEVPVKEADKNDSEKSADERLLSC